MQGKLTLKLDELKVDSFDTDAAGNGQRGTVEGNSVFSVQFCDSMYDRTCNGYGTCGIYPCRPIP